MPYPEDISDLQEKTINGDGVSGTDNYISIIPADTFDPSFLYNSRVRCDLWIWHLGVDSADVATSNEVYFVTKNTEDETSTPWVLKDTSTREDPYLFEDVPMPHKLLMFCKAGESVKIKYRYVIRDAGKRTTYNKQ